MKRDNFCKVTPCFGNNIILPKQGREIIPPFRLSEIIIPFHGCATWEIIPPFRLSEIIIPFSDEIIPFYAFVLVQRGSCGKLGQERTLAPELRPQDRNTGSATTKSLNWIATTKSVNWIHHHGALGLSEAAASRQTTQSVRGEECRA